jgi:uncharacterized protein YyaL (SSP411 family)
MNPPTRAHTNSLANEKSPYLLQHAHNPVNWFAWGDAAFEKARRENKPIFLSVGYSTCHWCHVMERETFEDEKVGAFLNEYFVSIKVDREERPDVDKIYMSFVQATTGAGGWPMSVFLTPDLKPFFGGTYFPPESRYGRPGFLELLHQIQQLWKTRQNDLFQSANETHETLERMAQKIETPTDPAPALDVLRHAGNLFKEHYDPRNGGFGGAPKFPQPSQPRFLLRYAKRFDDAEAIRMVLHTCERMAAGGIHDQLGGGFSRYSVDAEWLVPHFEKMLYDNAQLAELYLDAHLVKPETRNPESETDFAFVARDILDYVLRDMTHPDGGFYSAEDADSEGHEGKFYCWTRAELSKLLSPEEFNVAIRYFGITEQGNFTDHSHPHPLPNQNVLSIVDSQIANDDRPLLDSAKRKMLDARNRRIRPHLDDKVLASWNGLMLGAFARAYAVLGEERYLATAVKNLKFIQEKLWSAVGILPSDQNEKQNFGQNAGSTLFHRWRDGERDSVQLLEGYAFLLSGVIELYEAALDSNHLDFAIALANAMIEKFYDVENGGFWQSVAGANDLILRVKEDYDGAEPSGNSVAILALLKLGAITGQKKFSNAAGKSLQLFAGRLRQLPQTVPYLLQALDFSVEEPKHAVVAGKSSQKTEELLSAIHSVFQPNKIVSGNTGAVEEFARTLPSKEDAMVYICTGTACQAPTGDIEKIREMLR